MGILTLRIARSGGFADYEMDVTEGLTLLDALEVIRRSRDPGLRYRHSCHHGSCGTCGALVDGKERLLCLTRLSELNPGTVTVEPLRKMGLIGDLAVNPAPLFAEMPEGVGYLRPSGLPHGGPAAENGRYDRLDACIECGLCVSVCPVAAAFSGPAALAAADSDREADPSRESASLAFAAGPRGVAACESAFECSRACPQGVAPGRRIAALRRSLAERETGRLNKPGERR